MGEYLYLLLCPQNFIMGKHTVVVIFTLLAICTVDPYIQLEKGDTKMTIKFMPGDIVQLKSGGPAMTVESQVGSSLEVSYYCSWFAGAKESSKTFSKDALQTYVQPPAKDVVVTNK